MGQHVTLLIEHGGVQVSGYALDEALVHAKRVLLGSVVGARASGGFDDVFGDAVVLGEQVAVGGWCRGSRRCWWFSGGYVVVKDAMWCGSSPLYFLGTGS